MADDLKVLEKGLYKRWRASVAVHQLNASTNGSDGDNSDGGDGDDGVIRPSQLIDLSFLGDLMAEKAEYLLPFCHYRLLSLCADKVVMIYLALLKDGQKSGGCYFQANGPGSESTETYCTLLHLTLISHQHTLYCHSVLACLLACLLALSLACLSEIQQLRIDLAATEKLFHSLCAHKDLKNYADAIIVRLRPLKRALALLTSGRESVEFENTLQSILKVAEGHPMDADALASFTLCCVQLRHDQQARNRSGSRCTPPS